MPQLTDRISLLRARCQTRIQLKMPPILLHRIMGRQVSPHYLCLAGADRFAASSSELTALAECCSSNARVVVASSIKDC